MKVVEVLRPRSDAVFIVQYGSYYRCHDKVKSNRGVLARRPTFLDATAMRGHFMGFFWWGILSLITGAVYSVQISSTCLEFLSFVYTCGCPV